MPQLTQVNQDRLFAIVQQYDQQGKLVRDLRHRIRVNRKELKLLNKAYQDAEKESAAEIAAANRLAKEGPSLEKIVESAKLELAEINAAYRASPTQVFQIIRDAMNGSSLF